MTRSTFTGLSMLALLTIAASSSVAAEIITLSTLLDEMTQRDRMAQWPAAAYTCRQASSYDRKTTSPQDKATWYANNDHGQFIRVEENNGRREQVMMDAEGPGAVVRFWTTGHDVDAAVLRVYLDGDSTPVIEAPTDHVIDRGLLTGPPLSQGVAPQTPYGARGHNLYLPIPYAKHCKITLEGKPFYYQINYRTYAPGTPVRSFRMDQLTEYQATIARAQHDLTVSGLRGDAATKASTFVGKLTAGASHEMSIDDPGAIRELTVRVEAEDMEQALRSTVLEIQFDGQRTVWCPIGDFFGTGHKLSPYKSWYTYVGKDGAMSCWWVMPFEKSCKVILHNVGRQAVTVSHCEARVGSWTWDDRSMYFHSTWKQLTQVQTQSNEGADHGAFDVNFVTVEGRGVYVGDTLTLFNPVKQWWGEGDEKIFVDGEIFPSHIGTGTEDYYSYAWGCPNYFEAPFHAQPYGLGDNSPDMAVNDRYRALDAIPFTQSIQFDMELWHWAKVKINYAPSTFWYARLGAKWNVQPDPESAAISVMRSEQVVRVEDIDGAIEGEGLKVIDHSGGTSVVQNNSSFDWSRQAQLWWYDGKIGDTLTVEFPVEKAGRYNVIASLTKAIDYGIVKLTINDRAVGPFDRFNDGVATDAIDLGAFDLKQGPNQLQVQITGNNEKAVKRQMFGLDYLLLKPAQ